MRKPAKARRIASRYAGTTADGEFAVATITSAAKPGASDACSKPCPQCPWRRDAPIGFFPPEAYRHSARTAYDMAQTAFGCHMSGPEHPRTCAGFLLRGALHNLSIRMALMRGAIDLRRVSDGGLALYDDYRQMAEANGVAPDDDALAPCRTNGYD